MLDWQIKPLSKKSSISGRDILPGDTIVCAVFIDPLGNLDRADCHADEFDPSKINGKIIGRWERVVSAHPEEDERAARRMALSSSEDFFVSLFDESSGVTTDEADVVKQMLALLLELERAGLAHILGVAVSSACPASAAAVSAVNTFYGRSDIPVGAPKNGTGYRRDDSCFLDALAREFPHPVADNDDAEDAVRLMRRLLAAAPDRSVKLVTIGYLSNLDGLLRSGPDECSPLAGPALCAAKIREWVCMTGNFPDDPAIDNVNFTRDAPAALRAVRAWPGTVTFVGRDIGHNIFVGDRFHDLPESHPLRRAYQLHRGRFGENWDHHTADPSTILYAVCGLGPWFARQGGRLYLRDDCSFTWEPGPVGRMSYLLQVADRTETARVIDALTRPCHAPATAVPQPSPCTRPAGR